MGTLLTALTLAVVQLGVAFYVRNVVHDAAVEGAYHAALADTTLADGGRRAAAIITRTVGADYAQDIEVSRTSALGHPAVEVRIRTVLPLVGLLGASQAMEVRGRAPLESFD